MNKKGLSLPKIAGIACVLAFAVLISIRAGIFRKTEPMADARSLEIAEKLAGKSSWMNIYQNDKKIGYANREFAKTDEGFSFSEFVFMKLVMMGHEQQVSVRTSGKLKPDLTMDSFEFALGSSLLAFKARGRVEGEAIILETGEGKDVQTTRIPVDEAPFLGMGLMYAAAVSEMEPGQTRSFPVFDPATTGQRPALVTMEGETEIPIMGKTVPARKVSVEFLGNSQTAWLDLDGTVLAEESPLGIRMEKVSRQTALARDLDAGGVDLTEFAAIPVNETIKDPQALECLVLSVKGPEESLKGLHGGRQTFENGVLTVCRDQEPVAGDAQKAPPSFGERTFLESGPFIQTRHPEITALANKIVSTGDSPETKAKKIVDWVYKNIEKTPVVSIPDALSTLRNKQGDCNEHSVLVAALARAAGVPAQIETGVVYLRGRFYYHAWNTFYLGRWIAADAAFGQFPADVTHLRFIRGDPSSWMDVMGLLGQLELVILEQKK